MRFRSSNHPEAVNDPFLPVDPVSSQGQFPRYNGHSLGQIGLPPVGSIGKELNRTDLSILFYSNRTFNPLVTGSNPVLLFPFLGMQKSVFLAVAVNSAVALGALGTHWRKASVVTTRVHA
jgi:hypothetical protein